MENLINKLAVLKQAFREVDEAWNSNPYLECPSYPFDKSFDELTLNVEEWCDDFTELAREVIAEKEPRHTKKFIKLLNYFKENGIDYKLEYINENQINIHSHNINNFLTYFLEDKKLYVSTHDKDDNYFKKEIKIKDLIFFKTK